MSATEIFEGVFGHGPRNTSRDGYGQWASDYGEGQGEIRVEHNPNLNRWYASDDAQIYDFWVPADGTTDEIIDGLRAQIFVHYTAVAASFGPR